MGYEAGIGADMSAIATEAGPLVEFRAHGIPRTKGSMVFVTRRFARNSSRETQPWQAVMAHAARQAHVGDPWLGPVEVHAVFVFARPKSHGKRFGVGRPKGAPPPTTRSSGDLDKLCRCLLDALIAVVVYDDSQVVRLTAEKRYATAGEGPGVAVRVAGIMGP